MIKLCKVLSEDKHHKYQGTYVRGYVYFDVGPHKYTVKYDATKHILTDDDQFDKLITNFGIFYDYLESVGPRRFCRSVLYRQTIRPRMLFGSEQEWNNACTLMLDLTILTLDGRYLTLGLRP